MKAPSEDIKDILLAESSMSLSFGQDLFVGLQPESPDNITSIFDTIGRPPQLTMDVAKLENPSIAIQVRSNDYQTGYALAEQIKDALHGRANETWNGTLYMVIYCVSGPFVLNWDENRRVIFSINFNVMRR